MMRPGVLHAVPAHMCSLFPAFLSPSSCVCLRAVSAGVVRASGQRGSGPLRFVPAELCKSNDALTDAVCLELRWLYSDAEPRNFNLKERQPARPAGLRPPQPTPQCSLSGIRSAASWLWRSRGKCSRRRLWRRRGKR
mmetsp:Transcript_15241/g.44595  ORF Transcript_15241/g.44595 Transcript_15241/m.44595 type:complete len:137 (-) Transcript_15241:295-705(-)